MNEAGQAVGAIVLHAADDVAVLAAPVEAGGTVVTRGAQEGLTVRSTGALGAGHKLALHSLAAGTDVRKYGEVIGRLTQSVAAGDHVHIHNLVSLRGH
jgi:altronate hydrolase/altronate dehydratase small subunit